MLIFSITQKVFNYLLPVPAMRRRMFRRVLDDGEFQFSFMGTYEEFKDAMLRCRYLND